MKELRKTLKYVIDKSRVYNVIERINELPSVSQLTLDHREKVEEARKYYDALTPEEKELVTNINKLIEVENRLTVLLLIQDAENTIKLDVV